jgi:hypothetical protein
MPGDGLRAGVQARPGEVFAQGHDRVFGDLAGALRAGMRAPGPRLERRLTLGQVPGHQDLHPAPGDPYSRATTLLDRPSRTTAVITTRATDIAHHPTHQDANDAPRHPRTMS